MYYFSKIYTDPRIYLTIAFLSFIINEHVFSAEKIDWEDVGQCLCPFLRSDENQIDMLDHQNQLKLA